MDRTKQNKRKSADGEKNGDTTPKKKEIYVQFISGLRIVSFERLKSLVMHREWHAYSRWKDLILTLLKERWRKRAVFDFERDYYPNSSNSEEEENAEKNDIVTIQGFLEMCDRLYRLEQENIDQFENDDMLQYLVPDVRVPNDHYGNTYGTNMILPVELCDLKKQIMRANVIKEAWDLLWSYDDNKKEVNGQSYWLHVHR